MVRGSSDGGQVPELRLGDVMNTCHNNTDDFENAAQLTDVVIRSFIVFEVAQKIIFYNGFPIFFNGRTSYKHLYRSIQL